MDINLTLIVQMLVFAVFVLFTMKLIWPPISRALEERQERIAEGLSAAERGRKELELAQHRAKEDLKQAKAQAAAIIDKANRRATQILEEGKDTLKQEAVLQAKQSEAQLLQQVNHIRESLRKEVAGLAVIGAEKILRKEIDAKANQALLDNLIEEI